MRFDVIDPLAWFSMYSQKYVAISSSSGTRQAMARFFFSLLGGAPTTWSTPTPFVTEPLAANFPRRKRHAIFSQCQLLWASTRTPLSELVRPHFGHAVVGA